MLKEMIGNRSICSIGMDEELKFVRTSSAPSAAATRKRKKSKSTHWKWTKWSKTAIFSKDQIDCLEKLFQEPRYSDLVLRCSDREFQVHRAILFTNCPGFESLFATNQTELEIEDLEPEILEEILHFIYTGKSKMAAEGSNKMAALYSAAHRFGLAALKDRCRRHFASKFDVETV